MESEHTGVVLHQLWSYLHCGERARRAGEPRPVRMHRPVEASRSAPGTETKRLIRKPYKMTLKTERSGSRFVAARTEDGNPSIRLELFHDSVPTLKFLTVGFEVLSGTTPAQLKALLDVMNERIVGTMVTPTENGPS
jgi:hypothetical protein